MTRLTAHFTLEEMVHSQTAERAGLPNKPDQEAAGNLVDTAQNMERVRELLGHPIIISSGYRSIEVNKLVGGAPTSAHCRGHAVDFICPSFGDPLLVAQAIAASEIEFDQLIREYGWVHISFDPRMRHQLLTKNSAGEQYEMGLF